MTIKKNLALTDMGFKIATAYKFEFLLALITTPISLFIYYFLWKAIYAYTGTDVIRGFTFEAMINYFVLSTIIAFFAWSDVDAWMEHDIIHGDLIYILLRPIKYIADMFYFEIGLKLMNLLVQTVPIVIGTQVLLGFIFMGFEFLLLGILSLFMASTIFFLISMLIGFCAFWMGRIQGIRRMKRAIILFMSGGMIPLSFFPAWFETLSHFLPFEYIRYVPINIYLGNYSFAGAGFSNIFLMLGIQLVWVVLLYIACKAVWSRAFKKFAGAGA